MKYSGCQESWLEIPTEYSLVIAVSKCPFRCSGCHSTHLRDDIGVELDIDEMDSLLGIHGRHITCVTFLGGEQHGDKFYEVIRHLNHTTNYKVALYTGGKRVEEKLLKYLDFLKVGSYIEEKGGLTSERTNQVMYKVAYDDKLDTHSLEDITHMFRKKLY